MNIRSCATPILLSLVCQAPGAHELPSAALAALRSYSEAFNRYDCDALLSRMSPPYVDTLILKGARADFCRTLAEFKEEGATDKLGALVAFRSSGPHRIAIVANERTSKGRLVFLGHYAVHSSDEGRTWHVLDNDCDQEGWLWRVYPPYAGEPLVPPMRVLYPPYFAR